MGSEPHQNGVDLASRSERDPAEQTAIEEASVIHLLRVLVAQAAPAAKVFEDAMDRDSPSVAQAQDIEDITCEEAGCLLWDMSASRPVARVMLRNHALEALEIVIGRELEKLQAANKHDATPPLLTAPPTPPAADYGCSSAEVRNGAQQQQHTLQRRLTQNALRILEICLGTLANLIVTQPTAAAAVSGRSELLALVLAQPRGPEGGAHTDPDGSHASSPVGGGALYVDDARVLSELFRFLSLALRCQGSTEWLGVLSSPPVLQRVMWIGAATTDTQLFARLLDMLVALLHAASGAWAVASAEESASGGDERAGPAAEAGVAEPVAATVTTAAAASGCGPACYRVLSEFGLLGLLHQVLLQALRGCMPAEEKYGDIGSADADVYGSASDSGPPVCVGGSPPSIVRRAAQAAVASATAAAAAARSAAARSAAADTRAGGGRLSDAGRGPGAGATAAETTPRNDDDDDGRFGSPPGAVTTTVPEAEFGGSGAGVGGGGRECAGSGGEGSPADDAAAADAAALDGVGAVPLSDEAVDATLRLIEELVSPSGPLAESLPGDDDAVAGRTGRSGTEVLLQLHAERGLRPGLLQLLLGLLRCHYDSMQVVEGLLVVLVDMGPVVQEAVATSTPDQAAAVAARLVELLQDSCYSPADGASSSVVQLQQGAWYLLAATLRGMLASVARTQLESVAAAAEPAPDDVLEGALGRGSYLAGATGATAGGGRRSDWRATWTSLERCLGLIPELPQPEGCEGYVRACCVAGIRLMEQLRDSAQLAEGQAATSSPAEAVRSDGGGGSGSGSDGKLFTRCGELLQGMLDTLTG